MIQPIWELKMDKAVPYDIIKRYELWKNLNLLNALIYNLIFWPRWPATNEFHFYSDTSNCAYGADFYFKLNCSNPRRMFILSKSRVAPLRENNLTNQATCTWYTPFSLLRTNKLWLNGSQYTEKEARKSIVDQEDIEQINNLMEIKSINTAFTRKEND